MNMDVNLVKAGEEQRNMRINAIRTLRELANAIEEGERIIGDIEVQYLSPDASRITVNLRK